MEKWFCEHDQVRTWFGFIRIVAGVISQQCEDRWSKHESHIESVLTMETE